MPEQDLSPGELEMLIHGLDDDVALIYAMDCLGMIKHQPLTPAEIETAFTSFERLVSGGFMLIGRTETVPGSKPFMVLKGREFFPYRVVPEELSVVRQRVEAYCTPASAPDDWEWSCWLVNTDKGHAAARAALAARQAGR